MDAIAEAKWILRDHFSKTREGKDAILHDNEIFLVKFAYVLGGWKCELATLLAPGYLFQITHNKDFHENYLDVYVKKSNHVYADGEGEITSKEAASRPDLDHPDCPVCGKKMVWSMGDFICNDHTTYDEATMEKVRDVLLKILGGEENNVTHAMVSNAINDFQNAGILFRERA